MCRGVPDAGLNVPAVQEPEAFGDVIAALFPLQRSDFSTLASARHPSPCVFDILVTDLSKFVEAVLGVPDAP